MLRAKDVNLGLGADVMSNAYKFYNSVTVRERMQIQETFDLLFSFWWASLDNADFTIQPLTYNAGASLYERIGKDAFTEAMNIVKDPSLSLIQKRNSLKYGLGLSEDEIIKMLPNVNDVATESIPLAQAMGVGALQALMAVIQDPAMSKDTKINTMIEIFGVPETASRNIIESNTQAT